MPDKFQLIPNFHDNIPQHFRILRSIICYSKYNGSFQYQSILLKNDDKHYKHN